MAKNKDVTHGKEVFGNWYAAARKRIEGSQVTVKTDKGFINLYGDEYIKFKQQKKETRQNG